MTMAIRGGRSGCRPLPPRGCRPDGRGIAL